ncbi:MAG TPA: TonB-dependent receptor [Terriglobales bacterium]|nr:TonB-dependent receptor [Terriglobales bacterium]
MTRFPARIYSGSLRPRARSAASTLLLLLLLHAWLAPPHATAQLYSGSVSGTVTDATGAVIATAKVTMADEDKGYIFSANTDGAGRYIFRDVLPGRYTLSVEARGFQSSRQAGLLLAVNQNAAVDVTLKVGSSTEVVQVQGEGVQLGTEDAVTGQVVDRRFVNDLPLIDRNFNDLAFLAPGITEVDTQCPGCTATNFISNGSRNSTADILLDGVTSSNFEQNSGILAATYTPSVDAVEEFKVQQSNFSAEYGFSGATVLNVITRSGTNAFHGSAYDFVRNQEFDANDWFNNYYGVPRAPLRRNNFGATFGGPIWKDHTFFFVDYDGLRERSFSSSSAGVPTAAERAGNFGELCTLRGDSFDGNGICSDPVGQIYDPFSGPSGRTPIPNNDLSTYQNGALIDPVAQKLMQLYPQPTNPATSYSGLTNNWFGSGTNSTTNDQFDVKIDHRFSERNLLSGKYSQQFNKSHAFNCFGNQADPCTTGTVDSTAHLFALNETYTFNPQLLLNVSFGFTRGATNEPGIVSDFPSIDPVADLGLPAYMTVSGYRQYPAISLIGYTQANPSASIGNQTYSIIREGQQTYQLLGVLSWVRGAHELKFGGEFRIHQINFTQPGYPGGAFAFDNSATSSDTTGSTGGDAMASFLMGVGPMSAAQPAMCNTLNVACNYEVPNAVSTENFQYATFLQDNYRINPKLTLNLGLRYEISLPRTERYNRMNWLNPNLVSPLNGGSISYQDPITLQAVTRTLDGGEVFANPGHRWNYDPDFRDIQPRFGFSYQLARSIVMRGGYGIYFSTPRSGAAGTGPWGYQGYDQQTTWIPTLNNQGNLPGARLSDPFPGTGPKLPPGNSLGALNDIGFAAVGPIPKMSLRTPYEQSWSFGFQKQLPWKMVGDASYIGKKGTRLYWGGFREQDRLGPFVDQMSPSDIANLTNQVANPFQGIITDPLSGLSGPTVPAYQLLLPYPQFTNFASDSPPQASSIFHALQLRLEKSFAQGLQFLATYTYSKSIDYSSTTDDSIAWLGGGINYGTLPVQDPNNLAAERAVSTWDIPHVFQISYVYALPFGRGRRFANNMNPVLEAFVGGWQTNGIIRINSGRPIIPNLLGPTPVPTYAQRPNWTGTLRKGNTVQDWVNTNTPIGYFADPQDLSIPDPYTYGSAPRTITAVRQPGANNATLSVFKQFSLDRVRESMKLEFRLEAFNAFNHPQFNGPDSAPDSPTYGKITSLANATREVQMALKLYF